MLKYVFGIMAKENVVGLSPKQTQMHDLFLANAKLIKLTAGLFALEPRFQFIPYRNGAGQHIIRITRGGLKTLKLANLGLYNELAHPLKQVLRNNKLVHESSTDEDMKNLLERELNEIQNLNSPD